MKALAAPRSLQARLALGVVALFAVLWCATAAWLWFDTSHELDELFDAHLAQAAAMVVAQQAADIDDDMFERAPGLHRYAPRVALQIWHEGELVMRSADAPTVPMLPLPAAPNGFADTVIDGIEWRVFHTHGEAPPTQVFVAERVTARNDILYSVLRGTLLPLLALLPVMGVGLWVVLRHALAPLRVMGTAVAVRQPQDLQSIDLPDVPTEMEPLLRALNRLFGRIGALIESERRFTADAAHELRTPIAAIRAQAQVALQAEGDDGARRRALQATLQGCDRATHMVTQLLTLARLESTAQAAPPRADLAEVLRQTLADLAPQALRRGQELDCEAPDRSPVAADSALLAVLVRNLVDNAMRYSPPGSRLRVRLAGAQPDVAADGALLTVEDSGPGLDDDALKRLGERFFRAQPAADGPVADGSGLGLSIVQRVAEVQGWRVAFDRSPELGGLRVRVMPA